MIKFSGKQKTNNTLTRGRDMGGSGDWKQYPDSEPKGEGPYLVVIRCDHGDKVAVRICTHAFGFTRQSIDEHFVSHWTELPDMPKPTGEVKE